MLADSCLLPPPAQLPALSSPHGTSLALGCSPPWLLELGGLLIAYYHGRNSPAYVYNVESGKKTLSFLGPLDRTMSVADDNWSLGGSLSTLICYLSWSSQQGTRWVMVCPLVKLRETEPLPKTMCWMAESEMGVLVFSSVQLFSLPQPALYLDHCGGSNTIPLGTPSTVWWLSVWYLFFGYNANSMCFRSLFCSQWRWKDATQKNNYF